MNDIGGSEDIMKRFGRNFGRLRAERPARRAFYASFEATFDVQDAPWP